MENWKPINDFNEYSISNKGRIKNKLGKILSPFESGTDGQTYNQVELYKNGDSSKHYIHRLVYDAFGDDTIDEDKLVDHIDRNTFNNDISNLRAATSRENNLNNANNRDKPGVYEKNDRFASRITIDGKDYYLGIYDTEDMAHRVYNIAKAAIEKGCFDEIYDKISKL